jgi:hypothetical protein
MHPLTIGAILALGIALLDRPSGGSGILRIERWLSHRYAPVFVGMVTAVLVGFAWGDLAAPGAYHDERAYLVQARLLADFSWTVPSPPVPLAWEMAHVFVEPAVFAKYPPGHSLVLVPGIWLGLPALIPTLLAGIAAGLLFELVRRVSDGWSAMLGWVLWTTSTNSLHWHASYFSETTTTVLWLGLLLALFAWVQRERSWLLVGISAAVAWIGITRPVTGVALALPVLVVVLLTARRRRTLVGWRQAAVVGVLICAIVPYWSWHTTGSLTQLPYPHYSKLYFPFDMPGFVRDTTPPMRELPPDLVHLADVTREGYRDHVPSQIPTNFLVRSQAVILESLGTGRTILLIGVPIAAAVIGGGKTVFLMASFALLIAGYLSMPHKADWTVYYLEIFGMVPALAAIGLARGLTFIRDRIHARRESSRSPAPGYLVLGVGVALMIGLPRELATTTFFRFIVRARQLDARDMIANLPEKQAVVFVRRTLEQSPHFTLIDIRGNPSTTPLWIVRDLGDSVNLALLTHAGSRTPYLLDEAEMTLIPYPPQRLRSGTELTPPDTAAGSATVPAGP